MLNIGNVRSTISAVILLVVLLFLMIHVELDFAMENVEKQLISKIDKVEQNLTRHENDKSINMNHALKQMKKELDSKLDKVEHQISEQQENLSEHTPLVDWALGLGGKKFFSQFDEDGTIEDVFR